MSKELTPLEALEKFVNAFECGLPINGNVIKTIETALEDSEWYKQEMIKFEKAFTEENEEKLKLKQVLEIIKEKGIDIDLIKKSEDVFFYNNAIIVSLCGVCKLTQEEFDLLKEILK